MRKHSHEWQNLVLAELGTPALAERPFAGTQPVVQTCWKRPYAALDASRWRDALKRSTQGACSSYESYSGLSERAETARGAR
jgi:hypothetical protein